jgi:hypothetical protein
MHGPPRIRRSIRPLFEYHEVDEESDAYLTNIRETNAMHCFLIRPRGVAIALVLIALGRSAAESEDQADRRSLATRAREISKKFGIEIDPIPTRGEGDGVAYSPATVEAYGKFLSLLEKELSLYPVSFLRTIGLKRLRLCGEIVHLGGHCGAFTVRLEKIIYIDVNNWPNPEDSQATAHKLSVHHELYHVIDDIIYFDAIKRAYSDPGWKALNDPCFLYHNLGGEEPKRLGLDDSVPGFLTGYSRQAITEDKADLFAWMIVRPDLVDRRRSGDPRLDAKVRRLESVLKQFCGEVDEKFWVEIHKIMHN